MGEAADMLLDGTCCEQCGVFLDGDSPGYPRLCGGCDPKRRKPKNRKKAVDKSKKTDKPKK